MFSRFALFLTPDDGPLARFGARWLGWDIAAGTAVAHPELPGVDVAAVTARPRRYGLHGTIKPPFRLSPGTTQGSLQYAVARFCATHAPVTLDGLTLDRLGRFLALVPQGDPTTLADLASAAVQQLDPFRAPATPAEMARRRSSSLSPAEDANLLTWGYPYVLDCFRFHITLTGPLPTDELTRVQSALAPLIEPLLPQPFTIDSLTLCGEAEDGHFHTIERYPLAG